MGAIIVRYAERSIPFAIPVALFFAVGLLIPGYIGVLSLLSLLVLASLLGIAAIGQTITVLIGGIDLSIPAVIGLADVLLALRHAELSSGEGDHETGSTSKPQSASISAMSLELI